MGFHLWRNGHGSGACTRRLKLSGKDEVCQVPQPARADADVSGGGGHPDRRYVKAPRPQGQLPQYQDQAERNPDRYGGGACQASRESKGKACRAEHRQHAQNHQ